MLVRSLEVSPKLHWVFEFESEKVDYYSVDEIMYVSQQILTKSQLGNISNRIFSKFISSLTSTKFSLVFFVATIML